MRTQVANGGDPRALREEFFGTLERYLSPSEAAALRKTFDPEILALDLSSADAVFSALRDAP